MTREEFGGDARRYARDVIRARREVGAAEHRLWTAKRHLRWALERAGLNSIEVDGHRLSIVNSSALIAFRKGKSNV